MPAAGNRQPPPEAEELHPGRADSESHRGEILFPVPRKVKEGNLPGNRSITTKNAKRTQSIPVRTHLCDSVPSLWTPISVPEVSRPARLCRIGSDADGERTDGRESTLRIAVGLAHGPRERQRERQRHSAGQSQRPAETPRPTRRPARRPQPRPDPGGRAGLCAGPDESDEAGAVAGLLASARAAPAREPLQSPYNTAQGTQEVKPGDFSLAMAE